MTQIIVNQMPTFKKVYKKLHTNEKSKVNNAIRAIIQNPRIGEEKKGDLAGVFVYKFKVRNQETLLAYEWNARERLLLALGVHLDLLNQAPASPYFAQTLSTWEQGRFIRFHGLAQWVGWLWPYATLVYVLFRVWVRDTKN